MSTLNRGNDTNTGTASSDKIGADSGDETLYAGAGGDGLSGGSAGDTLYGGMGSDPLGSGSGNDIREGGPGDDALVYVLAGNTRATDVQMGGPGVDTVRMILTTYEFKSYAVRLKLTRYLQQVRTVEGVTPAIAGTNDAPTVRPTEAAGFSGVTDAAAPGTTP